MTSTLNITPLEEWLPVSALPMVIAGPCSAESEEQIMETAFGVADIPQVKIFRAGIWKRGHDSEAEGPARSVRRSREQRA